MRWVSLWVSSMNIFIALIILVSVVQLFACHISLWWFIAVIARLLFSLRIIGATFKVKKLCIVEGVAFACMLVFHMVFSKGSIPWLRLLLFLVLSAISCLCMFLDDLLYVYVVEDDED